MTVILRVRLPSGVRRRCDSRCHRAKGDSCRCICTGLYHGAGRNGTLNQKIQEHQEELLRGLGSMVTAAVLPLKGLSK